MHDVEIDRAVCRFDSSSHQVSDVAPHVEGHASFGGGLVQEADQRPHGLTVGDEEIDVAGHAVSEVGAGKGRASGQVTGSAGLTGSYKI